MEKTKNYEMFKEFSSNREVDPKHVNKLVREIQENNLLHVNPIIVSNNMEIVDGQHRLEAAKILGVEIYYIKGNVSRADISKLNTNQKNWGTMDYINYYTIEGKKEFIDFSRLINHYPSIKVSALLAIVNPETRRSTSMLKDGFLDIMDIEIAREVCDICYYLNDLYGYQFVFDSRFPVAIKKALKTDEFNITHLYDKIAISPRSFVSCHNIDEYCSMIEEVYNYRMQNKLKIGK